MCSGAWVRFLTLAILSGLLSACLPSAPASAPASVSTASRTPAPPTPTAFPTSTVIPTSTPQPSPNATPGPLAFTLLYLLRNIEVGHTTREHIELLLGEPCQKIEGTLSGRQYIDYLYALPFFDPLGDSSCPIRIEYKHPYALDTKVVEVVYFSMSYMYGKADIGVGNLIAVFGPPEAIYVSSFCGGDCGTKLVYPEQGLELIVDRPDGFKLTASMEVWIVTMFGSMTLKEYRIKRGVSGEVLMDWDEIWCTACGNP